MRPIFVNLVTAPSPYIVNPLVKNGEGCTVEYEAKFFPDGTASKKAVHRGVVLEVKLEKRVVGRYELIIGDNGKPALVDVDVDPVEPSFATAKE